MSEATLKTVENMIKLNSYVFEDVEDVNKYIAQEFEDNNISVRIISVVPQFGKLLIFYTKHKLIEV